MQTNGWNSVELRDNRYNQIIHMVSAANGAEDFYSTEVCIMSWNRRCYVIKWCKTLQLVSKSENDIMLSYCAQVLANRHFNFS